MYQTIKQKDKNIDISPASFYKDNMNRSQWLKIQAREHDATSIHSVFQNVRWWEIQTIHLFFIYKSLPLPFFYSYYNRDDIGLSSFFFEGLRGAATYCK